MNDAVGIDIGGTKVLSAVVSESEEVKDSVEVKTVGRSSLWGKCKHRRCL